jgi:hypothetical protein
MMTEPNASPVYAPSPSGDTGGHCFDLLSKQGSGDGGFLGNRIHVRSRLEPTVAA